MNTGEREEFVPIKQALELKELGFDKPCFGVYYTKDGDVRIVENGEDGDAPTFSQCFRWFREKYNLHHSVSILQRSRVYHFKIRTIEYESDLKPFGDSKIIFEDGPRKKYEDIELDCLKTLIEIVKEKK